MTPLYLEHSLFHQLLNQRFHTIHTFFGIRDVNAFRRIMRQHHVSEIVIKRANVCRVITEGRSDIGQYHLHARNGLIAVHPIGVGQVVIVYSGSRYIWPGVSRLMLPVLRTGGKRKAPVESLVR